MKLKEIFMKKYDFVFIYEGKNRELEGVCLLAQELEKRGYSVKILQTWQSLFVLRKPTVAKVTIGHALYSNQTLSYIKSFVQGCQKFVNMQWEQIFTNGDKEYDVTNRSSSVGVSGKACTACHLSWGENNYEQLVKKYNIPIQKVRVVGNVALDFLLPQFDDFYMQREELFKKYCIPNDKKVCLFISSFSYSGLPDSVLESDLYQNQSMDVREFEKISIASQKSVLDWFEQFLLENEEYVIIYRPHPAENDNLRLLQMEKNIANFYVVGEMSVKQWIKNVDKIFMWYSTSMLEVYAAGKNCSILRPQEIPYVMDLEMYNKGKYVTSYEQFVETFFRNEEFPIPEEDIKKFCFIDINKPSYVRICDYLEQIYNNSYYQIDVDYEHKNSFVRRLRYNIYMRMLKRKNTRKILEVMFPERIKNFSVEEYQYNLKMYNNNYASSKEIREIKKKIRKCLESAGRI